MSSVRASAALRSLSSSRWVCCCSCRSAAACFASKLWRSFFSAARDVAASFSPTLSSSLASLSATAWRAAAACCLAAALAASASSRLRVCWKESDFSRPLAYSASWSFERSDALALLDEDFRAAFCAHIHRSERSERKAAAEHAGGARAAS